MKRKIAFLCMYMYFCSELFSITFESLKKNINKSARPLLFELTTWFCNIIYIPLILSNEIVIVTYTQRVTLFSTSNTTTITISTTLPTTLVATAVATCYDFSLLTNFDSILNNFILLLVRQGKLCNRWLRN